ncbi:hypothetical protein K490DRAFT_51702 [Saccharata proteae CBS 121410]|uniref:Zn(2)-C6 fungal-type domain-containing protein n=1 Tax=Saccharata proteae CBS 121410 TaxID=1314787 RepID=A0A9P4HMR6_9PEZI|nr:hypothetical protein K490DRAFT_51702 [Saccharata proteae CBS 121410]
MLSTGLHQYTSSSSFGHLPSPNILGHDSSSTTTTTNTTATLNSQRLPGSTAAFDALPHGPQYALHQYPQGHHHHLHHLHHLHHHPLLDGKTYVKQRPHPYVNGSSSSAALPRTQKASMAHDRPGRSSAAAGPVRRRISRACDQCNQLRTKCDGKNPCAHCVEFGLTCEYVRERKKRGKASRKDIAQQQAAQAAAQVQRAEAGRASSGSGQSLSAEEQNGTDGRPDSDRPDHHHRTSVTDFSTPSLPLPPSTSSLGGSRGSRMTLMNMSDYGSLDDYHRNVVSPGAANAHIMLQHGANSLPHSMLPTNGLSGFGDSTYAMLSPQSQHGQSNGFRLPPGDSPLSGLLGNSPVTGSPGWLSLPSPSTALYSQQAHYPANQTLRYPVLQPLVPHLGSIVPVSLACDLLDLYFQSSSSAFMQPISPYVLGYVFRKRSFLRQHNPRVCSPALLASMLWIGAQTHESAFLTSPPSTRGKVCQKLLELTVGLLKPLIHTPEASNHASPNFAANTVINGVALGGFGVAVTGRAQEVEGASPGSSGALDDVATYIHLATVVSASEYKAASLRWWNAAWSLARELKLGRELPPNPSANTRGNEEDMDADGEADIDMDYGHVADTQHHGIDGSSHQTSGLVSEEEREERRRIWWLLYTMDRHLALCYNRPLFLLDKECDSLLQPLDESRWQAGEYFTGDSDQINSDQSSYYRRRGPSFECTGHAIFGFFTPLMTILGAIVDLSHAKNHPRFGNRFRNRPEWEDHAAEIGQQLEAYGRSLQDFEARYTTNLSDGSNLEMDTNGLDLGTPSAHSVNSSGSRITESILQTKIVVAYATHLMHTLHILLNGKWDPISLLDDNDLWISSQSFVTATGHAVSAAEALSDILEYDPDLSFMPFFFGIYLLQGSFLLLLIADKLQGEASPSVVKACETIVRAHEACVVTLNTEYQRNFRKVMRSALAQVRGRCLEDWGEQQLRRREVLALYRWTGDGTGLAL